RAGRAGDASHGRRPQARAVARSDAWRWCHRQGGTRIGTAASPFFEARLLIYLRIVCSAVFLCGRCPSDDGASAPSRQKEQPTVSATAPAQQTVGRPDAGTRRGGADRRQALRTRIIELGIQAIWGKSAFPAAMAADVPLMSAGLRMAWLRALGAVGVRKFVATSGLGHDFICHVGDLAEYPYYYRRAFQHELTICAAWLREMERPVVYDVGANV